MGRARTLALTATASIALAGCGGGGGSSAATSAATTATVASTTSSTPPTTASTAGDAARAARLVFVAADLPTGWTGTPSSAKSAEDLATEQELNTCIGTSGTEAESAHVSGDDFSMGDNVQVGSEAAIVKDESVYRRDVAAVNGPKVQPCLKDVFTKVLTKAVGTAPTAVQIASLPTPAHGDLTVGLRMTVTFNVQGQTTVIYLDAVLMGKDRGEMTATFLSVGQPFDAALERSLVDKLGARLDAG